MARRSRRYRSPYRRSRRRYRRRGGGMDQRGVIAVCAIGAVAAVAGGTHPKAIPAVAHAVTGSHAAHTAHVATGTLTRTVTGSSEDAFIRAVLAGMGAPATSANISSLAAWFPREFPAWPPPAVNNPMATTQPAAGTTTYNSAGVKNYPTAAEGAQATATTLGNGYYPGMAAALRAGRGLCGGGLASEFLTWSGGGYSGVC